MNAQLRQPQVTALSAAAQLATIASVMQRHAYRFSNEAVLQGELARLLEAAGYAPVREHRFDARNRADLWLPAEGLVIEVKVDGSLSHALSQVCRYCELDAVRGVLLAAATAWGAAGVAEVPLLHGRAFHMVHLQRRFL